MESWQVVTMFGANLIVIVAGIGRGLHLLGRGLSVLISVRDEIQDLKRHVGVKDPPDGLLGDMAGVKYELGQHRDTLIEVTSELGLRRPGGQS